MLKSWLINLMFASLTILFSYCGFADERDELIHRATAMKREATELRKNGHHDEAEQLADKAAEMMKRVQTSTATRRVSAEKELDSLRAKLEQLERAAQVAKERNAEGEFQEIRAKSRQILLEIEKIESHGHSIQVPPQFRERAEKLEFMAQRMRHLRAAAENLKAAEMHDLAHEVIKKAEHLEQQLGQSKRELAEAIQEMNEVQRAEDVSHLRRKEKQIDADAPLHRELDLLRKELRDAHDELRRLRSERATSAGN